MKSLSLMTEFHDFDKDLNLNKDLIGNAMRISINTSSGTRFFFTLSAIFYV